MLIAFLISTFNALHCILARSLITFRKRRREVGAIRGRSVVQLTAVEAEAEAPDKAGVRGRGVAAFGRVEVEERREGAGCQPPVCSEKTR